jgi:transcriptional regulator with XRE-family HTH domain
MIAVPKWPKKTLIIPINRTGSGRQNGNRRTNRLESDAVRFTLSTAGRTTRMKTFGQVIREARKLVGLTQKAVAEQLQRGDGRKVLPPYLNDLEHDRRYPPEDPVIEQLATILNLSSDVLYFYARRVPPDVRHDATDGEVEAAYRAFRRVIENAVEERC